MSKRGAYKRPARKPTHDDRITKLEGRLDGLAQAFAELESRVSKAESPLEDYEKTILSIESRLAKVEVVKAGPQEPDPPPPDR